MDDSLKGYEHLDYQLRQDVLCLRRRAEHLNKRVERALCEHGGTQFDRQEAGAITRVLAYLATH